MEGGGALSAARTSVMLCLGFPDETSCGTDQLVAEVGLSVPCALCFVELSICTINDCLAQCVADFESADCMSCVDQACGLAFHGCSGIDVLNLQEP